MPALRWTSKNGAFKYKDKLLANGPVATAAIKSGQIKIVAKGARAVEWVGEGCPSPTR